MKRLETGHREILFLRNELHRSYDQIARELGINTGTVKSRIARARGKLREQMTAACPEFALETAPEWFEPMRSHRDVGSVRAA